MSTTNPVKWKLEDDVNNHNIPVDQRVVYVAGMLISIQDMEE